MPPWSRWWVVQDFADRDSRCNSAGVRDLLDADEDGKITAAEATAQLRRESVQKWLKRALVKIPTEWEKSSIDARWGWLKQNNPSDYAPILTTSMNAESFSRLKAFLEMLCFWEDVQSNTQLAAVHWHFEPREFIKHFRKFSAIPGLVQRWSQAKTNHRLPVESDLQKFAKISLYEYAARSSQAAVTNHRGNSDFAALQALDNGDSVIFGMRVETDIDANLGRGLWDDRVTILKREETGLLECVYSGPYTTEPSGRYLHGGAFAAQNNSTINSLPDAGGDSHKDTGRLIAGRTYEYAPWHSPDASKGPNILGQPFNVLRKTTASYVERLVTTTNTLPNGVHVSSANTRWITGNDYNKFSEKQTMHFHIGYSTMTGSAGCQTFPTQVGQRFLDFATKLGTFTGNSRYQYILVTM
jgi:hypothetical protein